MIWSPFSSRIVHIIDCLDKLLPGICIRMCVHHNLTVRSDSVTTPGKNMVNFNDDDHDAHVIECVFRTIFISGMNHE